MYFFDASSNWQLLFQDPASPVMEGSVVLGFSSAPANSKLVPFSHNTALEIVWTYSDYGAEYGTINVESYMLAEDDLPAGSYRLLETNYRVVVPTAVHVRALVTSADVLHSWAIPSLGVKVDACPGRLNQAALFVKREGVYYGQCSEICGVNHGFMPIVIQAVSLEDYGSWFSSQIDA
eukprot:5646127-Prorocentrum_lima.AAC.1